MMNEPTCNKCGKVLTPETAKYHPEYFLHDECLPESHRRTTPPSAGELTVDLDSLATEKEIESEWYGRRLKPYGKSCRMAYTIQQMAKLLEEWNKSQTPTTRMLISRVELEDLWTKTAALLRRYKGEQP